MSNERVILCGGLPAPAKVAKKAIVPLQLWGRDPNVNLTIADISRKMVANLNPVFIDLLEIAAYIYCADQATTRGGDTWKSCGARWRRHFQFHIPVREPGIWSSEDVLTPLRDTLAFLSDDEYEFTFERLSEPHPVEQYLDFTTGENTGFAPEEVILFSGGLDSLSGAIQEAVAGKAVALVSHRSSPKIDKRLRGLVEDLRERSPKEHFHVPVWVNKDKNLGREYTQRTRSFLYASLAAVVARIFGLSGVRFYENGVISINLPISSQVVGGRATRTTHPQVLNGFSDIFTALFRKPFIVENPFMWMTKAEVVRSIREAGFNGLIKHSVSCTHVWETTKLKTHCGTCSQCIDRRFATLSAGCPDQEDPEEMYAVDLLKGAREPGESRTMLESYVRTAKRVKDMSDNAFFSEFGEVHRVTRHIRGRSVDDAASRILDLYKRHAAEVCDVITAGYREHAQDISDGSLPSSSLLILALPEPYKKPATHDNPPPAALLALDEIRDGETNQGLLARIVGSGRFDGVNKKIGSRELFFIYLLFGSTRSYHVDGEHLTVVTEEEAARELVKWSDGGHLQFSGKDEDNPAHRIKKMWGEFVRQIEKEKNLKGLFTNHHKDPNGEKLYGLRLRPDEKQIRVQSIAALFRKTAEQAQAAPSTARKS
jgi:hypothetical protein